MKKRSSCTTILVGKKASIDGSIMIARNEDTTTAFSPVILKTYPREVGKNRKYTCFNKLEVQLPDEAMAYTGVPEKDASLDGSYSAAGFNEMHVAMSATESLYGSVRALAHDPMVKDGLAEEALIDLVLPYIHSAKEGVEYLGELIKKYGSAEGNGILFADREEAWYMEIPSGHHWVAVKIPEDKVAVAPNQVCIQDVDFEDRDNFMWSEGIKEFVDRYHLNPDKNRFCFRHIFGTYDEGDRIYNTPRSWDAMRILAPEQLMKHGYSPTDGEIPFIYEAEYLVGPEHIGKVLGSHFNETEYDPLGKRNSQSEKTRFRPISVSKTEESHILQINPSVKDGLHTVYWLSFGATAYSPYVPFFANISDVPESYKDVPDTFDINSAYWLYRALCFLSEVCRFDDGSLIENYGKEMLSYSIGRVEKIREGGASLSGKALMDYLNKENEKTANEMMEKTKKHYSQLLKNAFERSELTFKMNPDL